MDLITDLPVSGGHDSIVVVVDTFSKMAHFIPTSKTVTAKQLADLFTREVYRLHGLPKVLISDRDPRFTSDFWTDLFKRLGTRLNMSTAYHPQTDGQTERANRTLEQILRAYAHPYQDNWAQHLDLAEFAYNSHPNASTDTSPFMAVYGYEPDTPVTVQVPSATDPDAEDRLRLQRLLTDVRTLVQENLRLAKEAQAAYANKRRQDLSFKVGDQVKLDTAHLKLKGQKSKKLKDRFIGPFPVIEIINPVAYRLQLKPSMSRVHPVFHVSKLRAWHEDTEFPDRQQPDRPAPAAEDQPADGYFDVDRILNVKLGRDKKTGQEIILFKVRWSAPHTSDDDTWEPTRNVRHTEAYDLFVQSDRWSQFTAAPRFRKFKQQFPRRVPTTVPVQL